MDQPSVVRSGRHRCSQEACGAGPASLGHPTSRTQPGLFPELSASGGRLSTGLGAVGQFKGFPWAFTTAEAVPLGGPVEADVIQTVDNPSGPDKP